MDLVRRHSRRIPPIANEYEKHPEKEEYRTQRSSGCGKQVPKSCESSACCEDGNES